MSETDWHYDEIEVQRARGTLDRCEVLCRDGERGFVLLVRYAPTDTTFLAKRKLGAWVELSWIDLLGAVSRDIDLQRRCLQLLGGVPYRDEADSDAEFEAHP